MKEHVAVNKDTRVLNRHAFQPNTLDGLFQELDEIIRNKPDDHIYLYRGHADTSWLLDSTFVRFCKERIFNIQSTQRLNDYIRNSEEYNNTLVNLLLLKFGVLSRPSEELQRKAESDGVDDWFELMKRMQQFPEEHHPQFKGTNILDWSESSDVALYFANCNRKGDGILWICDITATGNTMQILEVGRILEIMKESMYERRPMGCPLVFHPGRQIYNQRAKNQKAAYIAQMDLRFTLDEMWDKMEEESQNHEMIYYKLIIPGGSQDELDGYLISRGVTENFIYP